MSCKFCKEQGGYEELSEGDVVPIHIVAADGSKKYEGEARLLEPVNSTLEPQPYPVKRCYECYDTINAIRVRWKVKFVTGPNKGFVTHRKVEVFYGTGIIHIKDELDEEE